MHLRLLPLSLVLLICLIASSVSARTTSRAKTTQKPAASKVSMKAAAKPAVKNSEDTTRTAKAETGKAGDATTTKTAGQKSSASKAKSTASAKAKADTKSKMDDAATTKTAGQKSPASKAKPIASAKAKTDTKSKADTKTAPKSAKSSTKTDAAAKPDSDAKIVLVKEAKASLYPKPEKGKAQASLTKWAPLEVKGNNGDYVQVETDEGAAGYVPKSAVSQSPYVSIGGNQVNVRSGPGNDDLVLFSLKNHYPVQVVEKKGSRVHIKDYEGDNGWLHESLLSPAPYVIVNQKEINARVTPGADTSGKPTGKVAFIAPKGVIFKVIETDQKTGWLHVKHEDGSEGWVSQKMVWGGAGR